MLWPMECPSLGSTGKRSPPKCHDMKKSTGGSQFSKERQGLGMQVTSSLAGHEHPTHKSYLCGLCWAWHWGQHSLDTKVKDWLLASCPSFHSAPKCQGEEEETSEKSKKSCHEQVLPWLLSVGQQARMAGDSKRIWGLAFPNNWPGQSWIWGHYCEKHQHQTCSLLCAPSRKSRGGEWQWILFLYSSRPQAF